MSPATYDVRKLSDPAKYDRLVDLESPSIWWELMFSSAPDAGRRADRLSRSQPLRTKPRRSSTRGPRWP
jgi:hypothetical protein